jgi:toxin ParE1/3/4
MSRAAVYLPEAENDIDTAYGWYDGQRAGLGEQFLKALRDLVDRLCANPHLYAVFHNDIRAAPLRRFPHVVYYRDRGTDILVVAVMHGRRSSRAWRGRI